MKEKGMTLVELLAVIVVLAIVSLIAVPTVLNIISRVRLNALKDSAYGLVEAGTMYNAQYQNTKNIRFDLDENGATSEDTENKLSYKGKVKIGTVIIDRRGKTTVCISDGKNSAYKNYNETKVTLLKKQRCYIPENSYIVYLDDGSEKGNRTLSEYTNEELTDIVDSLTSEINKLKENNETLKNEIDKKTTKEEVLNTTWPVGSIYITTTENTAAKVKAKLGGTWEDYGSGRTLVGVNTSDTNFNSVSKTGGNKTNSYTPSGTISGTSLTVKQIPSHSHVIPALSGSAASSGSAHTHNVNMWSSSNEAPSYGFNLISGAQFSGRVMVTASNKAGYVYSSGAHSHTVSTTASATTTCTNCDGDEHTHEFSGTNTNISTLQPYITVYMWKRTA